MGDNNEDEDGNGVGGDGSGAIPCPGRVPEQSIPQNWSSMAAALGNFSWTETGWLWGPQFTTPGFPLCIQFTIPGKVSWIHITESISKLHHPLQYRNKSLTFGHMTKTDNATQGKSTNKQRTQSDAEDPRHAYYPTGSWLGDVPSSHWRRRTHHHFH
jgi:hypothetical protein